MTYAELLGEFRLNYYFSFSFETLKMSKIEVYEINSKFSNPEFDGHNIWFLYFLILNSTIGKNGNMYLNSKKQTKLELCLNFYELLQKSH